MKRAGALWAGPPGLARANCSPPRSSCRATKPSTGGCVDEATAPAVLCPAHSAHAALDDARRAGAASPHRGGGSWRLLGREDHVVPDASRRGGVVGLGSIFHPRGGGAEDCPP